MEQLEKARDENSDDWFFDFLDDRFSRAVFLAAEIMKDQLNLIGIPFSNVMECAFPTNSQEESISKGKEIIKNLFERRNEIAHQNDRNHKTAVQNNITVNYVNERLNEIQKIADAIFNEAKKKDIEIL